LLIRAVDRDHFRAGLRKTGGEEESSGNKFHGSWWVIG
jgi:hypothetical protein